MNKPMPFTPACFASHLGPWAIEPSFLRQGVSLLRAGMWSGVANTPRAHRPRQPFAANPVLDSSGESLMYLRTDKGVAILEMNGAMQKGQSKFGGVSTVAMRANIRAATNDELVRSILLVIDSPGGTVSGTQSFADDIRSADAIKPVIAHIEDMGASAAYWAGSQARRITANRSAMVGSLGTFGVVEDSSGKAQMDGIKVHVLSTGNHKGAFVDGAPIKQEQLDEYQKLINELNGLFMEAVSGGRNMSAETVAKLFDGRVHVATAALGLGLIDAVESLDDALAFATGLANPPELGEQARRMRMARARK